MKSRPNAVKGEQKSRVEEAGRDNFLTEGPAYQNQRSNKDNIYKKITGAREPGRSGL